ncbi:MAG: fumarate hydratase, partial [Defluviitaleaceae bacterium]|nr:fumarate hydratase [Defluviitaleaceae bacterium]
MKEIHIDLITEAVAKCCISSCVVIDEDIRAAIETSKANEEKGSLAESVLDNLLKNSQIAIDKNLPICQDTGMVVVFVEIGQDCRIIGGSLESAINKGVAQGYKAGYLRKSVISDPLRRVNTQDNTPAVVHYNIVEGDGLKITVSPKGFGSENMSRIKMLKPSDGKEGIIDFVLDTVIKADSNPCPPIIVGIGIGGTFEKSALIAKLALQRKLGLHNPDKFW